MSDRCPLGDLFIFPTGRMRICKIRFVSTGENRGKNLSGMQKLPVEHARKCYLTLELGGGGGGGGGQ